MNGVPWSSADVALLRDRYPNVDTKVLAKDLGRNVQGVYAKASVLGLSKSAEYLASPLACRLRRDSMGAATRFPKGNIPFNKGMKGWQAGGRSVETQFKPGQVSKRWDPEAYVVGALRINSDGGIDIKVKEGSRAWRQFHVVLWEDVHGPVPKGFVLSFRDGEPLNVELENLQLLSRADLMRRNTIHNLPAPLKSSIQLLGQFKRRIREKQDRGSAQPSLRRAGAAVLDKENPMDIERAKAIADVAQVVVNSAKVENDHIKLTGQTGSGFIPEQPKQPALAAPGHPPARLVKGAASR